MTIILTILSYYISFALMFFYLAFVIYLHRTEFKIVAKTAKRENTFTKLFGVKTKKEDKFTKLVRCYK